MTGSKDRPATIWHVIAIAIVAVWGSTFVSTKVLIEHGLSPSFVFLIRMIIAYSGIWFFSPKTIFCKSPKEELKMVLLGLSGGTIYFWAQNSAISFTQTTNVSFIVCTTPLITSLLAIALKRFKMTKGLAFGSLLALLGMALVIYNGSFILELSPVGDMLALVAAVSWSAYSLMMDSFSGEYDTVFLTRKVFFWGMVGILPVIMHEGISISPAEILQAPVILNLLFLGVVASLACFIGWNKVLGRLGTVKASNYIYLDPVFTLMASVLLTSEKITVLSLTGSAIILLGLWLAEKVKD